MGLTESKISLNELSYVKIEKPPRRKPDVRTIPQCLEHYARVLPNKEAVVFVSTDGKREVVTFKELYGKSKSVAYNFLSLGVKRGEIVAISLRTCPEWLYATFGAMIAGAIPFSVPLTYTDGSDIIQVFERLQTCSCIVIESGLKGDNWKIFSKLLDSFSEDGKVSSQKLLSVRYLIGYRDSIQGAKSFNDLMHGNISNVDLPEINEGDAALFIQSSGSTGVPKVISHTHGSLMTFADYEFGPAYCRDGTYFSDRPFSWMGGFPFGLFIGQTRVTCSGMCPPPQDMTTHLIGIIKQERCHSMLALPSLIHEMVESKEQLGEDWPLTSIITGGQPVSKSSLASIGQLCKYIVVLYGGSEFCFICANVLSDLDKFTPHDCGQLFKGVDAKIVDSNGKTVPVGESGELYIRGKNVFKGYHNDPDRNGAVFTGDGWYKTDDVARLLKDGSLSVEGRISNKIISGGFVVSPEIMEGLLKSCPGVESAVLVPVPDDIQYQVVCACVKVTSGSGVTEAVLRKFCEAIHGDKERSFTVLPKYYLIMESFPCLSTGKVSRKALEAFANEKFAK